jgi:hypothetical protein
MEWREYTNIMAQALRHIITPLSTMIIVPISCGISWYSNNDYCPRDVTVKIRPNFPKLVLPPYQINGNYALRETSLTINLVNKILDIYHKNYIIENIF